MPQSHYVVRYGQMRFLGEFAGLYVPGLNRAILHQVYKAFPESSAAKQRGDAEPREPKSPSFVSKALAPLMALPTPNLKLVSLLPGIFW